VDPRFVLRAFENGVDGVFIGGCRLNECNYTTHGNYHALNMVLLTRRIMEHIGLNPDRLSVEFMSSAEGNKFAETTNRFVRQVKAIGPIGTSEGLDKETLKTRLEEASRLVPYLKRVNKDKLASRQTNPADYDKLFTRDEVENLFQDVVSYYIDPDKCQACMICAKRCPEEAIASGKGLIHVIDQSKCIKCETCYDVCPPRFGAVVKLTRAPVPAPLPENQRVIVRKAKEKAAS
jgi:coenzyme F420-reducing hydrogenase delta subunit/Fe-S-cluster-containing hydrogenase component 2